MLRQAFFRRTGACSRLHRCMMAATSKQKRSLDQQQLQGAAAAEPPSFTSTSPPLSPPPSTGSTNTLLLAAVGVAATGGAAYYWNTSRTSTPTNTVVGDKLEAGPKKEEANTDSLKPSEEGKPEKDVMIEPENDEGNRVTVITVPDTMKNTITPEIIPEPHPENGNRVQMKPKKTAIDDLVMTKKAISKLQTSQTEAASEALVLSHQSAWSAMDASFIADLDNLTHSQLRARVMQLAMEMKDRTKWEAVRLKEFLAMKEKETANQYLELLQKQRLEFESLLATRLRDKEYELTDRMRNALHEKDASIQSVISSALAVQKEEHEADLKALEELATADIKKKLEEEYAGKMAQYTEMVAKDLQQKVAALKSLTDRLAKLESALEDSMTAKEGSTRAHRLSAAALALAEKLETGRSAMTELQALKSAAGTDGVIPTALATIPEAVKSGIPTLHELQARFDVVYKKARQAALVPSGRPGLEGQLAGILFATLKMAPDPVNPAPEADKDQPEFVLSRARNYVKVGNLERALEQLEKLEGQAALIVSDWKGDVLNRLAVEKALKVIKMECALLNESLVGQS